MDFTTFCVAKGADTIYCEEVAMSPGIRSDINYWHAGTRKCGHTGRLFRSLQNTSVRSSEDQAICWLQLVTQTRPSHLHPLKAVGLVGTLVSRSAISMARFTGLAKAPFKR